MPEDQPLPSIRPATIIAAAALRGRGPARVRGSGESAAADSVMCREVLLHGTHRRIAQARVTGAACTARNGCATKGDSCCCGPGGCVGARPETGLPMVCGDAPPYRALRGGGRA